MSLTTPTLRTPRLRLRPVAAHDADALWRLHSDPEVVRYWDSPAWEDPSRADAFLARNAALAAEDGGVRTVIVDDAGFVGWVTVCDWSPPHRSARLGYCLAPRSWGRGYATEAARALLAWGFATLDLHRVQAEVDTRHPASARVLEKLGFRLEGTLREDCVVDGVVSDSWVFGLLRPEFAGPADHSSGT
ncbi:GNAT family N-acetyltransferase [Nocardioides sp.]|uniref:GNAT family N-acetyltransferase n=1 Tax=Nocardioides sp. TaxID=35761 RepID=UPI0035119D3F